MIAACVPDFDRSVYSTSNTMPNTCLTKKDAEELFLSSISTANIKQWSKTYSAAVHLAGDYAHASSIKTLWQSYGISTTISSHETILDAPGPGTAVRLIDEGNLVFTASLVEDVLPTDPTSSIGLPAFHGLSYRGRVIAHLVYANFGRPEDFQFLADHNIDVKNCVVLCKYSANLRGLKVRAAQDAGATGVILYNDPQEDGIYTTTNGYLQYPDGPARHPSAIQRGSVSYFSVAAGQYPTSAFTPQIPSVPISYRDALVLLKALEGHGLGRSDLPPNWQGSLPDIEYCTGRSLMLVDLVNDAQYNECSIHNVIGTIEGTSPECVVIGNHHDSWSAGAVDPVSGSAVMNEIVRTLGILTRRGWKPRRKMYVEGTRTISVYDTD
jgi:N-acetylated-alpha-linked acidic dipeptidase